MAAKLVNKDALLMNNEFSNFQIIAEKKITLVENSYKHRMKPGVIPYHANDFIYQSTKNASVDILRPKFPEFEEVTESFFRTVDIPLNKRNFIYYPCAPNSEFKQLGYCTTEYPYKSAGWNIMDRSAGILLKDNDNQVVGVPEKMGWRTTRCDVCLKEGLNYWEVEVIKGGTKVSTNETSQMAKKDAIDSSPHLRFGISRREASLESPVGFDTYGYGIRDQNLESIFEGKLKRVLTTNTLKEGDVLSFILHLPNREVQIQQAQEYTMRRINAMRDVMNGKSGEKIESDNISHDEFNTTKKRHKTEKNSRDDFRLALLEDIDYNDVIRDNISIRYKNQLFFEATDYVKTTKPEYYSSDSRERQDFYSLDDSYLSVYLNGRYLGNAFENLKPFLPPFSELQYNEKFYYGYWKNGEIVNPSVEDNSLNNDNKQSFSSSTNNHASTMDNAYNAHAKLKKKISRKGLIARNKYVNNNRLGYYPTVSCFNGGQAKIITEKNQLKFYESILNEYKDNYANKNVKTLDILHMEQTANDIVWDIIDEIEEELKPAYNLKPDKATTISAPNSPNKLDNYMKLPLTVAPSSPQKTSSPAKISKIENSVGNSTTPEFSQSNEFSTLTHHDQQQLIQKDENNMNDENSQVCDSTDEQQKPTQAVAETVDETVAETDKIRSNISIQKNGN